MRLLSITLMLVAATIMVQSAAASKEFGDILEAVDEHVLGWCKNKPEGEIKRCFQDMFEYVRDSAHFTLSFIQPCSCYECIEKNLARAAFDGYVYELIIKPCTLKKDAEEDKILSCMNNLFDTIFDDSEFELIKPKDEWDILTQMGVDCHNKGKRGEELVKCTEETYTTTRAAAGEAECQTKESRNVKLYDSLRALLKRYQK